MPFKFCPLLLLSLMTNLSVQAKSVKRTTGQASVQNGCASSVLKFPSNRQDVPDFKIPAMSWIQTPSIVEKTDGHYQALGRVIHMSYVQEQLATQKKVNFAAARDTMDLVQQLDILADTVYIQGTVVLRGFRNVKIYARTIVGETGSKIDVLAPNWNPQLGPAGTGLNGVNGDHGEDGPNVEIFSDVIHGLLDVASTAGIGRKGQEGGKGALSAGREHTQPPKTSGDCSRQIPWSTSQIDRCSCNNVPGTPGRQGPKGGNGGNAGRPGNGGNAGNVNVHYRRLNGQVKINSCRGNGAQAANNGQGGQGGEGGHGGYGRNCKFQVIDWTDKRWCTDKPDRTSENEPLGHERVSRSRGPVKPKGKRNCGLLRNKRAMCKNIPDATVFCKDNGRGPQAPRGPRGDPGNPGSTPSTAGQPGSVSTSMVQSGTLGAAGKGSYPRELLVIMRRQAEDLLLSNSDNQKGREALEFIRSVTDERSDVDDIKNYVKRKLGFLDIPGYDIFGKNEMSAPRIKWEALADTVESIKDAAQTYETAFNDIIANVENKENFQEMASKMSEVSALQVKAEKGRLEQAKLIAESEKRMCLKFIRQQEEKMESILENIEDSIPQLQAQFNANDWIALLQGIVGISKAIKGEEGKRNPLDFIDTALSTAKELKNKACLPSLESHLESIKKWLTFGDRYEPREDPSSLDFDQLDVGSVPEIMQANLEMNKEKLTAELVCLLEVAAPPQTVAAFKAELESFFIAGSARIDLIGKVLELDNELGGHLFDIPLLDETEKAIAQVSEAPNAPISTSLQQNFLDYLLGTYRVLERSFVTNIYLEHKAFAFRTLWEGHNPLEKFRRVASESARGTGRLNGAIQLTEVLQTSKRIHDKAVKCFTYNVYSTGIEKWSFDNVNSKPMFDELAAKKRTTFSINIEKSCPTCYNVRLLKIYIELYGTENQPDNVPSKVHLKVRHLSGSYFRVGNTTKEYRQPLGSFREVAFNRFSISDEAKCEQKLKEGRKPTCHTYCVTEDDSRLEQMCTNPLNKLGSAKENTLLGMEECRSPFGTYELQIPVDDSLECDVMGITNTNCKALVLTKFTHMNVWTHFFYWSGEYPEGPDDPICKIPSNKRHKTATVRKHLHTTPDDDDQC